jgi:L-methionine (R)-S-oxide reductase
LEAKIERHALLRFGRGAMAKDRPSSYNFHHQTRSFLMPTTSKREVYETMAQQLEALLAGEKDVLANAANTAAMIYQSLPMLNWVGFYFLKGGELVLGPFQGKPACTRVAMGRGVCGAAAVRRETLVVPNVHEFPGHIACDCESSSEIVVPVLLGERLIGVLDVDSPILDRFDVDDREGMERAVQIFVACIGKNLSAVGAYCD